MATRGTISIQMEDGTVRTVYSHWDNYITGNGKLLVESYSDREEVMKLINGGDISSLGSYVSEEKKSFDRPQGEDYTTFYSYRGEVTPFRTYKSFDDYVKNVQFEEYNYFFAEDDVWSVISYATGDDWVDLEFALQEGKHS